MFSPEWSDVNFTDKTIMVRAAASENDRPYRVPMNDLAFDTIHKWRKQRENTSPGSLVFPSSRTGKIMDTRDATRENLLERSGMENFRWRDSRHDFAPRLAMKEDDPNTKRELTGRANMKMTLGYAHLAPENKLRAVKPPDSRQGKNIRLKYGHAEITITNAARS
jgi:site-specific recombinase XerC